MKPGTLLAFDDGLVDKGASTDADAVLGNGIGSLLPEPETLATPAVIVFSYCVQVDPAPIEPPDELLSVIVGIFAVLTLVVNCAQLSDTRISMPSSTATMSSEQLSSFPFLFRTSMELESQLSVSISLSE